MDDESSPAFPLEQLIEAEDKCRHVSDAFRFAKNSKHEFNVRIRHQMATNELGSKDGRGGFVEHPLFF